MITIKNNAETLDEGIKNLMSGAKEDYEKWSTDREGNLSNYQQEQLDSWNDKIKVTSGKKYIKIIRDRGVFAFIMKEDSGNFKKGDVLKAAGFNKPALNKSRGNVLTGNYPIQWTGPLYLK
jgi:hypothetical protein